MDLAGEYGLYIFNEVKVRGLFRSLFSLVYYSGGPTNCLQVRTLHVDSGKLEELKGSTS